MGSRVRPSGSAARPGKGQLCCHPPGAVVWPSSGTRSARASQRRSRRTGQRRPREKAAAWVAPGSCGVARHCWGWQGGTCPIRIKLSWFVYRRDFLLQEMPHVGHLVFKQLATRFTPSFLFTQHFWYIG